MAQPFNMRYPLVDGQGNFGSVDGDPPAAMRYTEARLARISEELLADIEKETVDFIPNFDETEQEPVVLPTRVPNLLVNGASGIAVGMATNIPPHNLKEIIEAAVLLVEKPDASLKEVMKLVPGPDFPTGGYIAGRDGIEQAYKTGRGSFLMRAKAAIEQVGKDRENIVVTEIPYQVNKSRLVERIAELVQTKKIEGISDVRDESDRDGMRIVIEIKRGEESQLVLNHLYKLTQMQESFGMILLAITGGQPREMGLVELLRLFLEHRRDVVLAPHALRSAQGRRARAHPARLSDRRSTTWTTSSRSSAVLRAAPTPARICTSISKTRPSRYSRPRESARKRSRASSSTPRDTGFPTMWPASATSRSTPSSNCNCTA